MPRSIFVIVFAFASLSAQTLKPTLACGDLRSLTDNQMSIGYAVSFPATADAPEHCRVRGQILPQVGFEVNLPAQWNGRLHMSGNGGYAGDALDHDRPTPPRTAILQRGYATVVTDTGHSAATEPLGTFAADRQKLLDYAFRSLHVTAVAAKTIARAYYGSAVTRSYFQGCSTGGRQALILAQRFPEDFDGIIAGAPVLDFTGTMTSYGRMVQAFQSAPIAYAKLPALASKIYEVCDAKDGLKDGIIDDPRRCHFDPAKLLCKTGTDDATCLTAPQVDAAKKMYEGTKNPRTGEVIFTGWPRGSEGFGDSAGQSWRQYVVDPPEPMRVGFFRYWLFHDPNWDYRTIDWERDLAYAEQKLPFMAAVEKDLTPFKKHGGKLLMYTGWADPVVPPQDTAAYYEGVVKAMGGLAPTRDFYRFFTAPGMGHCAGGPGPNQFDAISALEQWVEKGTAPDKLIATHSTNGKIDRTRPLCTYPLVARYKGTGSTDEAANFACVAAPPAPPTVPAKTTSTGGQR